MTTQPNLKSAAITNLDANPAVRPSAGREGGVAYLYEATGIVGPTTDGDTTGGVLRAVRVPSNACIKSILVAQAAATTTAAFDIGLYWSDAADGTTISNQAAAADADCFATAVDTHALVAWTEEAFEAGTYKVTDTVNPIWQLSTVRDGGGNAITTDPGGFFDICFVNTATISGAATMAMRVQYTLPAV
jgi:hypothetical protein